MSNKNKDELSDNCSLSLSGGGYEVDYSQFAKAERTRPEHLDCVRCQHIDNTSVDSPCWACRPGENHGTNFTPYHEYDGSGQNGFPRLHWWERAAILFREATIRINKRQKWQ